MNLRDEKALSMNTSLPSGTVTFLFSDIESSTRLWEQYPDAMRSAVERHDLYLNDAIHSCNGKIVKTTGDGFHAVFEKAVEGVQAALHAQKSMVADGWNELIPQALRIRIGLYTGEASVRTGDYYGTAVNRAARLMAAGHGGQTLLSATTASLIKDESLEDALLLDLGQHRLKDLVKPEHIFQLSHPALPSDFPPIYTIDEYPNNLPIQLTSYIGREQELKESRRLLSSTRLLTFIGPGGTGKTRLTLQLAADSLVSTDAQFPNGVWLAEFALLGDPDLVVETIASIFNLRRQANAPELIDLLTQYLKDKQLLLIMDNCEHLVEACAQLADHLLRNCQNIKIIASSREALGISGELIFSVPSLALPDPALHAPADLLQFEAIQLFVERALAAHPSFRLTEQNAAAVAYICRRLDGIPLAIELAAARVKVFTAEQIAVRLDDRFRLLTGGSRTALPRQQTLGALIDWSYDLLSDHEQELFRRLSVFAGGWSYEAAESICPHLDVLNLLTNLVNKSLVVVSEQVGEYRYHFLETIRQYARDRLMNAGETVEARDRHLDYFLDFTSNNDTKIFFTDSLESAIRWLDRLDLDYENIRAAVEWGIPNRPVDALLLAGNMHFYIGVRASPGEGERWLQQALAAVEALPTTEDQQELEKRKRAIARGWIGMGQLIITLGESIRASAAFDIGIPLARTLDDQLPLAIALFFKSSAAFFMNDIDSAWAAVKEAQALAEEAGDQRWKAIAMASSSWYASSPKYQQKHKQGTDEVDSKFIKSFSPLLSMEMVLMAGFEARIKGDFETARAFLEQSLQYFPLYRSRPYEAMTRSELGHISRQSGDYQTAKEIYRQTISSWKDLGHRAAIANQIECFAFIARAEGDAQRAVLLFGAAEALREEVDSIMTDFEQVEYDREVSLLREQAGERAFEKWWVEGRNITMDEAIALAVTEPVTKEK
jgi:predicted ATPase/class 3 adenylate cyclase